MDTESALGVHDIDSAWRGLGALGAQNTDKDIYVNPVCIKNSDPGGYIF